MQIKDKDYTAVMNDAGELRVWLAERYGSSLYFGCHYSTALLVYGICKRLGKMIGVPAAEVQDQVIADFAISEGLD